MFSVSEQLLDRFSRYWKDLGSIELAERAIRDFEIIAAIDHDGNERMYIPRSPLPHAILLPPRGRGSVRGLVGLGGRAGRRENQDQRILTINYLSD